MGVTDWLPVLSGSSFDLYLRRLDAVAGELHARHGRIALVGHSAGGWIARILLGSELYQGVRYGRSEWVHTLLTLGTPHQSVEAYPLGKPSEKLWGPAVDRAEAAGRPGVRGSSLQFANFCYPDAASLGDVRVVTACGNAITGRPLWGAGSRGSSSSSSDGSSDGSGLGSSSYASLGSLEDACMERQGSRWDAYVAYEGYKSGCGRGDVDGDYVTPLCISTLPGAQQLVLPDVWHIPRRNHLWYGDAPVVDKWSQYLPQPQPQAAERISRHYTGIVKELRSRGFDAEVVPMGIADWLPVLSGSSFDWYLRRLDAVAGELYARHGRIALVGHSAGGWIARLLLGGELYRGVRYGRSEWVHTLLTLGTPHQSVEAHPLGKRTEQLWGPAVDRAEAAVQSCVLRSSLQFANFCYPDAASLGDSGCGRGDVDGDYMTPLCIFSLPGAEELVLPGVWHIPRRHHVWYGDAPVVNKWLQYLPVPQAQAAV
ncbi:PGAP1 [Micractinium conductrix]|uniref:GPI inositol-deacylase n=1 Tax=Micractinium conductrix TaxID=554055 RepID=A0A2P6VM33_9CHLO|nr:PGAP1 [Micractinium conductrix]|eukprot:PSC75143.1 PGAP1 [Micractinium conductrix]